MAKTIVESGQNIVDITIQTYGNLKYIFQLLQENSLNFTSSLLDGQEVNCKILPEGTPDREVQKFYEDRGVRVKTGSLNSNYIPVCPIPEGYVMWQFRVNETWEAPLLVFSSNQDCFSAGYYNDLSEDERSRLVALWVLPSPVTTPEQIAMQFALHFNSFYYNHGHAVNFLTTVTIFLRKDIYDCDSRPTICMYQKDFDENGDMSVGNVRNKEGLITETSVVCCNNITTEFIPYIYTD